MVNCTIILLLGPSKCGKTTFAFDCCRYLPKRENFKILLVTHYNYLQSYNATEVALTEHQKSADAHKNLVVLIDRRLSNRGERYLFYKLATVHQASYGQIFFKTDYSLLYERNLPFLERDILSYERFSTQLYEAQVPKKLESWEATLMVEMSNNEIINVLSLHNFKEFLKQNLNSTHNN